MKGNPSYTSESPPLHYNFIWHSEYGCPKTDSGSSSSGGIGWGWIFIIILFSVAFSYVVGGIVFLKFVRKAEGSNQK